MAIYVFSLMDGYEFSGVDSAQGNRNSIFKKTNHEVKYIFTQIPEMKYVQRYEGLGIAQEDMLSAHIFLAGATCLAGHYSVKDKIEELRAYYGEIEVVDQGTSVRVKKNNGRIAQIELREDGTSIWKINYYNKERLIVSEFYGDRLLYKNYYVTARGIQGLYAKLVKTSLLGENGQVVFDCIHEDNGVERYVYPNGMTYTKSQIIERFVEQLNLTEKDIVFIDRPSSLEYVQPLFQKSNGARIIIFLHSGHYYERGEDESALYLNYEYYYWFKYSHKIDTIIVSTDEQKIDLRKKMEEYDCVVPRIEVIPASGLNELKYTSKSRKKYSMLTVSRIKERKRIRWIINSTIEAHRWNPEITLDIYGSGKESYVNSLKEYVSSNGADDYIRFMGHCDVSDVYKNYEVYITASVWETLGLSVMEATGSGNAVIGLDTHYGNRLFIKHNGNGQLIDFDVAYLDNEEKVVETIKKLSEAILYVFQNRDKLEDYQNCSYEIAEQFLNSNIERKWLDFFQE